MQCGISFSLSLSLTATTAPFSFWMTSAWQLWAELPHSLSVSCIEATCRPSIFGSWNLDGFDWQVEFVNADEVKSPTVRHCIWLIVALSLQCVDQLVIVVHTLWGGWGGNNRVAKWEGHHHQLSLISGSLIKSFILGFSVKCLEAALETLTAKIKL